MLTELKGFKFVTKIVLEFKKIESDDKTKYNTFYSNSKAETIINKSNIDDVFESMYTIIISQIQRSLGKSSGWITDLVINHNISISKYNLLIPAKIWLLFKILMIVNAPNGVYSDTYSLQIIIQEKLKTLTKILQNDLMLKTWNFQSKLETFTKIERKNSIAISIFLHESNVKYPIYVSKNVVKKNMLILNW